MDDQQNLINYLALMVSWLSITSAHIRQLILVDNMIDQTLLMVSGDFSINLMVNG